MKGAHIPVLDKGYIRLVDHMGDDLSIVNAARVSYDKESVDFSGKDERLLNFLLREGHTSPLRHGVLTFEVYAPLMVARQWWKYQVASTHLEDQSGWNESSRRYVTEEPTFYVPNKTSWREAPINSKQGSGAQLTPQIGAYMEQELIDYIEHGAELYEKAMQLGVCAEQARLFLPAYGMYVRWRWTASLATVLHFLEQRLEHDAQVEIQYYAQGVKALTETAFPATVAAAFKEK